jgi:hypothetical protein
VLRTATGKELRGPHSWYWYYEEYTVSFPYQQLNLDSSVTQPTTWFLYRLSPSRWPRDTLYLRKLVLTKKDAPHKNNVSFNPCTKLTLHCNHWSEQLITEHTESLLLLRRHLGNWPRGPSVSMRSELLVACEKHGQFPLPTVYVILV